MKIEFFESVKRRDPSATSYLEIILCYPGIHALAFYRVARFLDRLKIPLIPRLVSSLARVFTGIEIHPKAKIGKNFFIDHGFGVVIGETAVIGNNVTIYQGVTLGGRSLIKGKRHPTIEDDVMISVDAKVLGAITIGKGAKIGPGAIVVENLGAGKIVVAENAREVISKKTQLEYWI